MSNSNLQTTQNNVIVKKQNEKFFEAQKQKTTTANYGCCSFCCLKLILLKFIDLVYVFLVLRFIVCTQKESGLGQKDVFLQQTNLEDASENKPQPDAKLFDAQVKKIFCYAQLYSAHIFCITKLKHKK